MIRKSCIQRHPYFYSSSDKPVTEKTTVKAAALFSALQTNVTVTPHITIWAVLRKIKYRKEHSCQEWQVDIIHINISPKKSVLEYKKLKEKKGQEFRSFRCTWVIQQHVSALCLTICYAMVLSSQKGGGMDGEEEFLRTSLTRSTFSASLIAFIVHSYRSFLWKHNALSQLRTGITKALPDKYLRVWSPGMYIFPKQNASNLKAIQARVY